MSDNESYFGRRYSYFGGDYWGGAYWGDLLGRDNLFENIIHEMEKKNIGHYCFEAGCVEPGIDNVDTPLRRILSDLEK